MQPGGKQAKTIENKIIKFLEEQPDRQSIWSVFDTEMMMKYYDRKGPRALSEALGKSYNQVVKKACLMGLRVNRGGNENRQTDK